MFLVSLILAGGTVLLAQLGQAGSFWPLAGYAGGAFLVLSVYTALRTKALKAKTNALVAEHADRYGTGAVRGFVQGFGEGFGEEFAKGSFESGEWVAGLVGLGIHWASSKVKDFAKSPQQRASEQVIAESLAAIEKQEMHAGYGFLSVIAACIAVFVLSNNGTFPLTNNPDNTNLDIVLHDTRADVAAPAYVEPDAAPLCTWHQDCQEYERTHAEVLELTAALIARSDRNILERSDLEDAQTATTLTRRLRTISCSKMKKKPPEIKNLCRNDRALLTEAKATERRIRRYLKR